MKKVLVGTALVAAFASTLLVGGDWALRKWVERSAECERSTLSTSASPDAAWTAVLEEHICSTAMFASTTVSDTVALRQSGSQERSTDYVFGVDAHGDPKMRPLLQWIASRTLLVTVPNKSLIGLRKNNYDDVKVVVRFDPDDPEERAQFLKGVGLPSK